MNKFKQVIVVEGYHDKQKINDIFPSIQCIVTNGSSISKETLNLIYKTSLIKEVIIFLDPDYPGKQITNKILNTRGNYKIAYIQKEKAISSNGKKVGVEHASREDVISSLNMIKKVNYTFDSITYSDLLKRGLINKSKAKNLRDKLCKTLNIPFSNGKTLLKTLNMLEISLERIDEIIG